MENEKLYEVAKKIAHEHGFPWTDPRTGETFPPPPKEPEGHEIKELFAWIVDDPSGTHGICGFMRDDGVHVQCVTSRRAIAERMRPEAQRAGRITGQKVQLVRFTRADVVEST